MTDLRRLTDSIAVAPQITPLDIAAIKAAGFTAIVNNRPDGEAPDQPAGDVVAAAAQAAGLRYAAIPVGHDGIGFAQLDAMAAALAAADGPLLAYCRSGTRSCHLWALTRARAGDDPQTLVAAAAAAGYDLAPLRSTLDRLAADA